MFSRFAGLCVATSLAAGCAVGRDFVRPDSTDLKVGQSNYSQVIAKLGEPFQSAELLTNDQKIKTIRYVYANSGGEPLESGVVPTRALGLYFYRDQLVGQEFVSSFKVDNTNFDDSKIPGIEKGKTTRSEVLQMLGKPTSTFVKPMAKAASGEDIGYTYQKASRSAQPGLKIFTKKLRVTFDSNDRVLEVDYSSSDSQ